MKIKLGFLLLVPFLLSCKSKEGSKLIYSKNETDYRIMISTIDTKINSAGIAQCSKYARTTITDSSYTSYGLQLKNVIAMAHETTPKYVSELPFDTLKNKYLDIRIDNFTEYKLNYDSILALALSESFRLHVQPVDTTLLGYELIVLDPEKLKQNQTECDGGLIKYEDGIWSSTALRLLGLTKILDQYSESYISFTVPNQNCYSFEFVVGNDFTKINEKLKPIGLKLNKTQIAQTYYEIKTVANNTYKQAGG